MAIRTLDLFHGVGGSSLGAKMAGAQIIAAIDYWEVASQCYSRNFPEALSIKADIRHVSPEGLHKLIGEIDLLVASPECTSHSCARGARDHSEESELTAFQVIRFAREFRPKWMVIENVVQMKSWSRHPELLEELWGLGYYVREEKLNSQEFAVPQTRRRLFLMCSLLGNVNYTHPSIKEIKAASSIIDFNGHYRFTPLFSPKRAKATIERAERAISTLGSKMSFLIVYYSTDGSGGWQPLDRPLRTITTLDRFAYVRPSATGHVMRMLQPEELKLAMGFPNGYKLESGTRRDKIKLVGNAVCPPVMKYVIRSLVSQH